MPETQAEPSLLEDVGYGGPLLGFEYEPVFATFFRRAEEEPEEPAIVEGSRSHSYGQLARDARAIAAFLRGRGLRGPDRVGVCVERSIEATAAMLGVLAAGLVYVPIDTRNARQRVEHMVATSGIGTVLASPGVDLFAAIPDLDLVAVGTALSADPEAAELPRVGGEEEAYVIYTSGTTGAPKGVVGRHLEFAKQLRGWMQIGYELERPRGALIASYGFDSSFLEHFLTLNGGGCLFVFELADICNPAGLAAMIERHGIEFAILSPALLGGVAAYFEESGRRLPLQHLVSGGEPVPNAALKRFQALKPDLDIRVGYGTTEATIAIATHRFDPDAADSAYSPVGRPMPGYYVFLLDEQGELVRRGEVGEIHVSGDLTKGYDSNPEETRRRFLPNPFFEAIERPDRRPLVYRTGDLACLAPDGALVFKGRVDTQVQIRGLRVELGEVEAAVGKAFGAEAHCAAFEPSPGRKSIVAYVVSGEPRLAREGLDALDRLLPRHMRPSHLVAVESLPVTINDKIDAARLPTPTHVHLLARHRAGSAAEAAEAEAAASPLETELIAAARELLEIEGPIAPGDLFVDLGADSLTIVALVVKVEETCEVTLPVKEMKAVELSARSLAELVEACRA